MDRLLTQNEVAARLRVSVKTLTRWRAKGEGPLALCVGGSRWMYRESDVARYLDELVDEAEKESSKLRDEQ